MRKLKKFERRPPLTALDLNYSRQEPFSISRNEKRRIEATGEVPVWPYYNEIDELLGSHPENSANESSTFDDTAEMVKSEMIFNKRFPPIPLIVFSQLISQVK